MALAEDNKVLVQRIFDEVFTGGNISVLDEVLAEDFVDHEDLPGFPPNREGAKQFFAQMHTAFPDLRTSVEDLIAEGDRVVARVRMSGTHRGDFMGIAATNKPVDVPFVDILRVENGKIAEHWGVMDQLVMMQQLGVMPAE